MVADLQADRDILKDTVDKQSLQLERAVQALNLLSAGHESRQTNARKVRGDVHEQVNDDFNSFLKKRRHSGRLNIDYVEHTLDMEVKPACYSQAVQRLLSRRLHVACLICSLMLILAQGSSEHHCDGILTIR